MRYTPLPDLSANPELYFFCDETSHNLPGFMAVGGIAVTKKCIQRVDDEFSRIRKLYGISTEIAWNKLRDMKFEAYKAVVDYFFSLNAANLLHFHCLIADNTRFNYQAREDGSKKNILTRMYYQLILHRCCRYYGLKNNLHVRPDRSGDLKDFHSWKEALNNDTGKRHGNHHCPVRSIQCEESSISHLLQMNDLILGAVGYYRNERHMIEKCANAKKSLALYVLGKSGLSNYSFNTQMAERKFSVWNLNSALYRPVSQIKRP